MINKVLIVHNRKGFSLVEVVIAIGIVAVLLTTFLTVFAPAQRNIQRSLSVQDATRLRSTLENEMSILRVGEDADYISSFDKAFRWVIDSDDRPSSILVYQYYANPDARSLDLNPDETPKVYNTASNDGVPGRDFITYSVAREIDDPLVEKELEPGVVAGPVYVVRMAQLVVSEESNSLEVGRFGSIIDSTGKQVTNSEDFVDGTLVFQAEFFRLRSNLSSYVQGTSWDFETNPDEVSKTLGPAVSTINLAVRR